MGVVTVVDESGEDRELAYDPAALGGMSGLEQIAADVEKAVAEPTRIRHPSPGMESYVLVFRSNVSSQEASGVEKRTKNSKQPVRDRNAMFLAITNTAIEKDGDVLVDDDGRAITFRSPALQQLMKAKTAAECVVNFLRKNDGHLIAVSDKVATMAGFGAEVEEVSDPT